jgi:anti-sigma B factor antagonist
MDDRTFGAHVDSIPLVVRLLADARRDGRGVRAVGLTPHYREIFRITRLSDFMDIEGDAA